jgi:hypothetical protein
MSRDSCRVNNPFCCELEECDVYYDTIEGICYLCKERHRYLRKKELAAEHAKKDENDQRKEKMDADVEMEEGEIRDQEMDVDKDSKEDRLEVVSPSDDPNEKQEREENLMSKKKQLAEIEQAMEEAKLLNEEYVNPFFSLG